MVVHLSRELPSEDSAVAADHEYDEEDDGDGGDYYDEEGMGLGGDCLDLVAVPDERVAFGGSILETVADQFEYVTSIHLPVIVDLINRDVREEYYPSSFLTTIKLLQHSITHLRIRLHELADGVLI